jgi:hexosaminidase
MIDSGQIFCAPVPAVPVRAVHLDLKGLPPTFPRLLELLELFANLRFNAVLIEWEDMFPWSFNPKLACQGHYTVEQVRRLAQRCAELGLELIPLVQCLGHLENVLRLPEYAALCEHPERRDSLNPLAPGTPQLVRSMVEDLLGLLPGVKHIHLGGDEAWTFGSHPDTRAYIQEHGQPALYMHHYLPVLSMLNKRGIRPILWHDMMMDWPRQALETLAPHADLMVWGYCGKPDDNLHHHRRDVLETIAASGVRMWGAGAFKGADGPDRELPVSEKRLVNHLGWAEVSDTFHLKGVVTTGWSRYAFPRLQVEPIDACLPELTMAALVLHDGVWPENGWAQCEQALEQCSGQERGRRLRKLCRSLQSARDDAWSRVRQLKEHLANLSVDATRSDAGMANFLLIHLDPVVDKADSLARQIVDTLDGLVSPQSARAYGQTSIAALRGEIVQIKQMIARL